MHQSNRKGYRGYIRARMEMGRSVPQHIQQLVMRDYCKNNSLHFLLSAVEYRMEGCTLMLDAILDELDHLEGIVMYSLYLFPASQEKRMRMYAKLFDKGCVLHAAAENIVIRGWDDVAKVEDTWLVYDTLQEQTPTVFSYLEEWDAGN
jgi:sporadic carbohydrate cluster protein (TIGR04323 family)